MATTIAISSTNAQETDPRLHPDGGRWDLKRAEITDPQRPRVLLIGDSILRGYKADVVAALEGKAYVDVWMTPLWQSERFNTSLGEVLDQGPYDVIHMNIGLHGWPTGRILPGTYEPLTRAFLDVIRKKTPKAKVIWASSTPTFNKQNLKEFNPEVNPTILEHNKMAAKIMDEYGIPINDFHALLVKRSDLVAGDGIHWSPPAYKILAPAATASIEKALAEKSQQPTSGDSDFAK